MSYARPALGGSRSIVEIVALGERLMKDRGGGRQSERARALGVAAVSASGYIRIAKVFGHRIGTRSLGIDHGALLVLAADGVPEAVRDAAVERALRGERITRRLAEAMVMAGVGE